MTLLYIQRTRGLATPLRMPNATNAFAFDLMWRSATEMLAARETRASRVRRAPHQHRERRGGAHAWAFARPFRQTYGGGARAEGGVRSGRAAGRGSAGTLQGAVGCWRQSFFEICQRAATPLWATQDVQRGAAPRASRSRAVRPSSPVRVCRVIRVSDPAAGARHGAASGCCGRQQRLSRPTTLGGCYEGSRERGWQRARG